MDAQGLKQVKSTANRLARLLELQEIIMAPAGKYTQAEVDAAQEEILHAAEQKN